MIIPFNTVVGPCASSGSFRRIHSGMVISEKGDQIDGAIRIMRTEIANFDRAGFLDSSDKQYPGASIFQTADGRYYMMLDRFNANDYLIGYEVIPCVDTTIVQAVAPRTCTPCQENCRKEMQPVMYYARKQRSSESDIPIVFNSKVVRCIPRQQQPKLACAVELARLQQQNK